MRFIPGSLVAAVLTTVDTTVAFRPSFSLGSGSSASATTWTEWRCSQPSATALNLLAEPKRANSAVRATTATIQAAGPIETRPHQKHRRRQSSRRSNRPRQRNLLLPQLFDLFVPLPPSSSSDASLAKQREDMLREQVYNRYFAMKLFDSWSRSGRQDAPERCMMLLSTFKKLASSDGEEEDRENSVFTPHAHMYKQILEAFATQGRGQEAEWTLKNFFLNDAEAVLEEPESVKEGFRVVLKAWSRSTKGNNIVSPQESMQHCLRVLEEMKHVASSGFEQVKPDRACYGTVIKAYCQRGLAEEAEAMLMEQMRDPAVRADGMSFTPVMSAWAKVPGRLGLGRCVRIFNVMKTMALEHGLIEVDPQMHHYNIVLDAFARRGMAHEAQKVLDYALGQQDHQNNQQQQRYRQHPEPTTVLRPDMYSFASVARAWVDSGSPEAPDRCRALLEQIYTNSKKYGDKHSKPDAVLCNTILDAYASYNRPEEAQALLDHMLRNPSFLPYPDIVSFNTCLKGWADASLDEHPEALTRCTDLMKQLQYLKTFRRQRRLTPTTNTYYYLIAAHIKRGKLTKASSLMLEMLEAPKTEVHFVLTNQLLYAWAKSDPLQFPNAPENILRLMDDIQTTAQKNGKGGVRFDVVAYNALINAYGNRGRPQEAEEVLAELWEKHPEGPDLFSFNGVVKAWSKVTAQEDDADEDDALIHCEQLVEKMNALSDQEGRRDLRPDMYTYSSLFQAYASRGMGREAQDLLESSRLEDLVATCSNVELRSHVYELTMKAWVSSGDESGPDRCLELLEEMQKQEIIAISQRMYDIVLMALVSHGRVQEAEDLLLASSGGDTEQQSWEHSFHSYNIVLGGWARQPNATQEGQRFWSKVVAAAWTERNNNSSSSWELYPNAISVDGNEFVFDRSNPQVYRSNGEEWQQETVSSESFQVLLDGTLDTLEVPCGSISPNNWRELLSE